MPKVSVSVPHALEEQDLRDRLNGLMSRLKERHGEKLSNLEEQWHDNGASFSFSTFGFKIRSNVVSVPGAVNVDIDLPFAAMMFKGTIEGEIRETLTRVLTSEKRQ